MPKQGELMITESDAIVAQPVTLMQTIQLAVQKDASIETLERLWALQKEFEAANSKRAYGEAMTSAQGELRAIAADASNPQTHSKYASYKALDDVIRPVYSRHGFSVSFNTERSDMAEHIRIVCEITHKDGHTERKSIDMPNDGKGAKGGDVMTKTHATGSAVTYGMRYLLKMAFNVAVAEDDDDGNGGIRCDPDELADRVKYIEDSPDADEILARYKAAHKWVMESEDTRALQKIIGAKNRALAKLLKKGKDNANA